MGFGWRDWGQLTSSFFYNCSSSVWIVYGKREGHVDRLYSYPLAYSVLLSDVISIKIEENFAKSSKE